MNEQKGCRNKLMYKWVKDVTRKYFSHAKWLPLSTEGRVGAIRESPKHSSHFLSMSHANCRAISQNPFNCSIGWKFIGPILQIGPRGSRRCRNLLKITQLVNCRARIQSFSAWLQTKLLYGSYHPPQLIANVVAGNPFSIWSNRLAENKHLAWTFPSIQLDAPTINHYTCSKCTNQLIPVWANWHYLENSCFLFALSDIGNAAFPCDE